MKTIMLLVFVLSFTFSVAQEFAPDTSVSGISLLNSASITQVLSNVPDTWTYLFEDSEERMKVVIMNNDNTQMTELFFHEGDDRNEFGEFRISLIDPNDEEIAPKSAIQADNIAEFITGKGIKPGVSAEFVRKCLGYKFKENKNGDQLLLSFTNSIKDTPLFTRYNMPVYYADYYFINDKLVKFSFGFMPQ